MSKIAIITGGSGGIGSAMVRKFSQKGYTVAFTYRQHGPEAQLLENQCEHVKAFACDFMDADQARRVAQTVLQTYGRVDVLVNNAGIMRDKTFLKMEKADWDLVIDMDLKSVFTFTQILLPAMVERKFGRIINISSIAGLKGFFGKTNYSAAKAGMVGFTRSLALEVAAYGVTVNAITPGMIDTQMISDIPEKYMTRILQSIPVGRLGRPEEVADLAVFLASDDSAYITGEAISVSGGL